MKYDVTKGLKGFDGKFVTIQDDGQTRTMTLRDGVKAVCLNAGDNAKGAEEKLKLYDVLSRTHSAEAVVDLSAEEVAMLKRIGGVLFSVALIGPFVAALEAPGA